MTEYSVIVLGTGGAGLRAALELQRAGLQVLVVSKGSAEASGATPSGLLSLCAASPEDPSNSVEVFEKDILKSGLTVENPALAAMLARDSYARLQDLVKLGMPWTRSVTGELDHIWLPGHSAKRAFYADKRTGKALSMTLLRACLQAGVQFLQYHAALDLVVEGGNVAGLVMLDWVHGQVAVWKCNAIIVASGGAPAIYRLHTNPPGQTGDGMAILLRAGGELVDMEFLQMYPTALVYPPAAYGVELATGQVLAMGARLLNRYGEEFFNRWEKGQIGEATRDVKSRAIAREIGSGGGTDAGGVYLDARNVPQILEKDRYAYFLRDLGVDPMKSPLQVAPGAHYSLGGVKVIPPSSCCGVAGVFAAGEVMGGVHGANRLAGNALTETQVFGALAGQQALKYLADKRQIQSHSAEARPLQKGESSTWELMTEAQKRVSGAKIRELREKLFDTMQKNAWVVRTSAGLEEALYKLDELQKQFWEKLSLPAGEERQLLEAVEMVNMLEIARALVTSALLRNESRGAHFRDDFPERNHGWDRHNLVVKGERKKMMIFRVSQESDERRQVWP